MAFAYLIVADWPGDMTRGRFTELLMQAVGRSLIDADQLVARRIPFIAGRLADAAVAPAAAILRQGGLRVVVIGEAALRTLSPPLRVRRLASGGAGRFLAELWAGRPVEVSMADVWLLIRAETRSEKLGQPEGVVRNTLDSAGGAYVQSDVVRDRKIVRHAIVELHLRDGSRLRIDGSKFNFDVLGSDRGAIDRDNMDRLALLLAGAATGAVVDTDYRGFGGLGAGVREIRRSTLDRERFPDFDPEFEFYSAFLAIRRTTGQT